METIFLKLRRHFYFAHADILTLPLQLGRLSDTAHIMRTNTVDCDSQRRAALGGPDDAGEEGRWIPTIAVDQYAATLASWFGADAATLANVLPNLGAFTPGMLGFV